MFLYGETPVIDEFHDAEYRQDASSAIAKKLARPRSTFCHAAFFSIRRRLRRGTHACTMREVFAAFSLSIKDRDTLLDVGARVENLTITTAFGTRRIASPQTKAASRVRRRREAAPVRQRAGRPLSTQTTQHRLRRRSKIRKKQCLRQAARRTLLRGLAPIDREQTGCEKRRPLTSEYNPSQRHAGYPAGSGRPSALRSSRDSGHPTVRERPRGMVTPGWHWRIAACTHKVIAKMLRRAARDPRWRRAEHCASDSCFSHKVLGIMRTVRSAGRSQACEPLPAPRKMPRRLRSAGRGLGAYRRRRPIHQCDGRPRRGGMRAIRRPRSTTAAPPRARRQRSASKTQWEAERGPRHAAAEGRRALRAAIARDLRKSWQ